MMPEPIIRVTEALLPTFTDAGTVTVTVRSVESKTALALVELTVTPVGVPIVVPDGNVTVIVELPAQSLPLPPVLNVNVYEDAVLGVASPSVTLAEVSIVEAAETV